MHGLGIGRSLLLQKDRDKAAFATHMGLFRPKAMMFGLCNAPATYQRYMDTSFKDEIRDKVCRVFIDDISGGAKTWPEFLANLRRVFTVCRARKILLKPKKCSLGFNRLPLLGRILEGHSVSLDPSSIRAVVDFPEPRTKKEVFSFLGLAGWCRSFVPRFAHIAAPLLRWSRRLLRIASSRYLSIS